MSKLRLFRALPALAALLLVACAPRPAATPTPAPTSAPTPLLPTATLPPPSPTVAPSPSPAPTDPFDGWKTITTDEFSINLPADWVALHLSEEEFPLDLEKLKEEHPIAAAMLEKNPPDFEQFRLFALGPEIDGVADGINIAVLPPSAQPVRDLDTFLREVIVPQYDLAGFKPTGKRTDLVTDGGLPMARLLTTPPQLGGGREMVARQYFILNDADLWVLTYTTVADRAGRAPTEFEKSAKTFAPR